MTEIRARKRFKYEKRGKLVRLNVSATERYIREEAADLVAAAAAIFFVHDPLESEHPYPSDPSHSLATGVPQIGCGPDADLIGDLFLDCILETFDVVPD